MFNPSRATARADNGDRALPMCIRRTKWWAEARNLPIGAIRVVNLFARRATSIRAEGWPTGAALNHPDWIGPDNDQHIAANARSASLTVAGWGPTLVAWTRASWRAVEVLSVLTDPYCLGVNKENVPYYAGPRGAKLGAPLVQLSD